MSEDFDDLSRELAARRARSERNDSLEAQAVALVKQYGFILPKPVKGFLGELADFLNWQKLKGVL